MKNWECPIYPHFQIQILSEIESLSTIAFCCKQIFKFPEDNYQVQLSDTYTANVDNK